MQNKLTFKKCKEIDSDFFSNHPVLKNHNSLLREIKKNFAPQDKIFFLKAPGRVNLIGEHTDYNMGPVLPCAINKEIVFCIRPHNNSRIKAINVNTNFSDIEFLIEHEIKPYNKGHWGNYIKAGVTGILDYLKSSQPQYEQYNGYDIIVSATLPQAAGISSSSALVVASALTFVLANNIVIDNQTLADICSRAEHFVGTAGGGMDQAASLLGKKDAFLYMEFNPLRIKEIGAPQGIQLILFSSLIQAEKSGKSRTEYNRRVLECRMGVDLFKRFLQSNTTMNQADFNFIGEIKPDKLSLSQEKQDQLVESFLSTLPHSFSIEKFSAVMGLNISQLNNRYQSVLSGKDNIEEPRNGFKIKSRFKHVYYECQRVYKAIDCLRSNNLNELGNLLNQSHLSLSQEYEVSVPEVDQLVKVLLNTGALGARIMGAGFGGMVLALADPAKVDQLIEAANKQYYSNKFSEEQKEFIIPCVTADGAGIL